MEGAGADPTCVTPAPEAAISLSRSSGRRRRRGSGERWSEPGLGLTSGALSPHVWGAGQEEWEHEQEYDHLAALRAGSSPTNQCVSIAPFPFTLTWEEQEG